MLNRLQLIERYNHQKPIKVERLLWPAYSVIPALPNEPETEQTPDLHVSAAVKQLAPASRFDQLSDYAKQMNIIADIRRRLAPQEGFSKGDGLVTISWDELNQSERDSSDDSFDAPKPKLNNQSSFNSKTSLKPSPRKTDKSNDFSILEDSLLEEHVLFLLPAGLTADESIRQLKSELKIDWTNLADKFFKERHPI
jgi:hypothetical protein